VPVLSLLVTRGLEICVLGPAGGRHGLYLVRQGGAKAVYIDITVYLGPVVMLRSVLRWPSPAEECGGLGQRQNGWCEGEVCHGYCHTEPCPLWWKKCTVVGVEGHTPGDLV
jgi:hypothetical protein